MTIADNYPALVLNADFRPLAAFPLPLWNWKDALHAVVLDRVYVAAEYDIRVRSQRETRAVPAVIVLKKYVRQPSRPTLTRLNLWLRDGGACAYCRTPITTHDVTFDHVVPRSRGGDLSWENVACSCFNCNGRKANRTPAEAGMHLAVSLRAPTDHDLARSARALGQGVPIRQEWTDYVYWDGALQR